MVKKICSRSRKVLVKPQNNEDGFTLLETLIAFVLLSLTIGMSVQIISLNALKIQKSSEYKQITNLVNQLQSTLTVDPSSLHKQQGKTKSGNNWELTPIRFNEVDGTPKQEKSILAKLDITDSANKQRVYSFVYVPILDLE